MCHGLADKNHGLTLMRQAVKDKCQVVIYNLRYFDVHKCITLLGPIEKFVGSWGGRRRPRVAKGCYSWGR